MIFDNIKDIYRQMSHAAMKAGRSPEEVCLLAVTKEVSAERIKEAVECGLRDFGESRVQAAQEKITSGLLQDINAGIKWHLIGHLQKNKAALAVRLFDVIHSVDSPELATALDKHAAAGQKRQKIYIQVKLSCEESKHGLKKDNLVSMVEHIENLKNLEPCGLMTIPPYFDDPESARPYFRQLRELRDYALDRGYSLPGLSMGMSHDFRVAIEEGATIVRIGTAIFGERRTGAR